MCGKWTGDGVRPRPDIHRWLLQDSNLQVWRVWEAWEVCGKCGKRKEDKVRLDILCLLLRDSNLRVWTVLTLKVWRERGNHYSRSSPRTPLPPPHFLHTLIPGTNLNLSLLLSQHHCSSVSAPAPLPPPHFLNSHSWNQPLSDSYLVTAPLQQLVVGPGPLR